VIISILVLIVTAIIVAGYVMKFVLPPRQLVVRVGEVSYTRGDMVKLLRLQQATLQATGQNISSTDDVFAALQTIVENEMISQAAPRLGISVTREQLDAQIRFVMAPSEAESLGKTEAQVRREFEERYRQYLNFTQVSKDEHRELVRKSILRERVRQFVGDSVPAVDEQVYLHRMLMTAGDEVDVMQTRYADAVALEKSPDYLRAVFKALAREFSSDADTIQAGGDFGWLPLGVDEDYEQRFFDLEVGELSELTTNFDNPQQFYFFMVSERSGSRPLSAQNMDTLKTRALQTWLNEERANHEIYAVFNSEIYGWIFQELRITSTITPTPAPPSPFTGL
jgi:parvulin-like peptidyl-prolyl isomerase